MSLFNKKTSSDYDEQSSSNGGSSKVALLLLLVLVGGFGYLYFFTSLIVPHETAPAKAPVQAAAPEVKQSMPPKPSATAPAASAVAGDVKKPEDVKPATAAPAAPAAPVPAAAKPAAAPPQAAAPASPPAKPAPPAPPAAAKPAAVPPPAAKPAAPAPATANKEVPPAAKPEAAKPAPPAPKSEAPKAAKAAAPAPAAEPAARKKTESFTVVLGDIPDGEAVAAAEAKLAKHKVKPVVKQQVKKSRQMIRLFYGAYTDYDAYTAALTKLKQLAKGAFAVEKDGKYSVYAGSFAVQAGADKEKKELLAKGVTVQLQPTVLSSGTVRITAGRFKSRSEADKAAALLKKDGLAVKVVAKRE